MHFHDWIIDRKVRGINVSATTTIGDYAELAGDIIKRNEFQRRRISTFGKTYELLRRDLLDGCVMPPLILAVTESYADNNRLLQQVIDECLKDMRVEEASVNKLKQHIDEAFNAKELMILDGLQRTHTIIQCLEDAKNQGETALAEFRQKKLRIEVYVGLHKLGLLYRMLTLNTGQTPMSFRHQIEIMYHDYLDSDNLPDGIRVVREVEGGRARGARAYKYQDVVDMFYAYTTGNPKSIDRPALVGQLKELDFLDGYRPEKNDEDMSVLLQTYHRFIERIENTSSNWRLDDSVAIKGDVNVDRPFGTDIGSLFGKVQPMTAFGAECHRLLENEHYQSLDAIQQAISSASFRSEIPEVAMLRLVTILDEIANKAKRIGDAQRVYFQYAFRHLLTPNTDAFQDLARCWLDAQQTYEIMV